MSVTATASASPTLTVMLSAEQPPTEACPLTTRPITTPVSMGVPSVHVTFFAMHPVATTSPRPHIPNRPPTHDPLTENCVSLTEQFFNTMSSPLPLSVVYPMSPPFHFSPDIDEFVTWQFSMIIHVSVYPTKAPTAPLLSAPLCETTVAWSIVRFLNEGSTTPFASRHKCRTSYEWKHRSALKISESTIRLADQYRSRP